MVVIQRIKTLRPAVAILLALVVSPETHWTQTQATRSLAVWYWQTDCRESRLLRLEISLDGRSIYQSSLHICRLRKEDLPPPKERPGVAFSFRGGHTFQGEIRTSQRQVVEANIWQAGGEPDGILMGISFSTGSRVLLNTLHHAKADHTSKSQLDRGLFVATYPDPQSR